MDNCEVSKKHMNIDKNHLDLLHKRINIDAPKIIIKNELKLIKDLIEKMLIQLGEK